MNNTVDLQSEQIGLSSYLNLFFAQVYGFMSLGVFITSAVALFIYMYVQYEPSILSIVLVSMPIVFILELLIVIGLSVFASKVNGYIAAGLFLLYSLMNGLFFGIVILNYRLDSVLVALGATFITFFIMSAYGYLTKTDLTKWGAIAWMALLGVIIGTVVNLVVSLINPGLGDGLYWVLTYIGLGIFVILVAYDSQRIKRIGLHAEASGGNIMSYSIQGALILYLDFINLFIRILSIMGKKK